MVSFDEKDLSEFAHGGEASREDLSSLKNRYPALPGDYVMFLASRNGGEGFIGDDYVILWRAEEIEPFNREYEVDEYAPGLLFFGSNGGGEAYAFDTRSDPWAVVRVPFIGMSLDYALPLAGSFTGFIERLARSEST